jgi:polyhydroxyalkanoate synthase|tara:strand:- start:74699 stop:76291 length:1593 start_codon:yes stop_codon:yes gene_type:complete
MNSPRFPDNLAQLQGEFMSGWQDLLAQAQSGSLPVPKDRRFSSSAWQAHPNFLFLAHAHLLATQTMQRMIDAADLPEDQRERLKFSAMQWLDAVAPSNYLATNPDVQQTLLETKGMSLLQGMTNFLEDMQKGRMSQTDESRFEVGVNLAVTPGQVIYENTLFQLIQYAPQTAQVYKTPLLMVPPCINKYYILDLQPDNSFVQYAVEQGFTVFMISWRNPQPADTDGIDKATWADYLQHGVLQAIDVVRDISGEEKINALGFCVGGTLLASALAVARARGENPVNSLSLLTTFLDFADTGILDIFVDDAHVAYRELQLAQGGLMSARELASTFSFLRPNELVWNYVVSNYLKGQSPPAFDLLYWNADGTNLPGPFFAWYLRHTYLENSLVQPGKVTVDGTPVDLGKVDMPVYLYGSREDHIVPWRSAYASAKWLPNTQRFVLGASGHIAGVVNPPARQKRSYWTADLPQKPGDPQQWFDQAKEHPGSWWPDWSDWLASHSGVRKRATKRMGNARHRPVEAAPGRYVRLRAV